MKYKKINNKGFTLFELLVSISIIALLTAVAVVSFGGVNKKARDSKRISDLEKTRIALEGYRQSNGTYPVGVGETNDLGDFLENWPVDPKSSNSYIYEGTAYTYFVCATVENEISESSDQSSCTGLPADGYSGYYKVINP
jgi:prepilin-type N-terminal cleavage/methylation domain-containing protein